jgi:hypothetical protein
MTMTVFSTIIKATNEHRTKKYRGLSIEHQLCSTFGRKISSSPAEPQTGDKLDVLQYIAISSLVHCRDSP